MGVYFRARRPENIAKCLCNMKFGSGLVSLSCEVVGDARVLTRKHSYDSMHGILQEMMIEIQKERGRG